MAPEDVKGKKRKGAADAAPKPKKQKKVDEAAAVTKKSAKALNAAVKPIDDVNVNVKVSRKRAAELFDDSVSTQDNNTVKVKKTNKKSKITAEVGGDKVKTAELITDVAKVGKTSKKASKVPTPTLTEAEKEKSKARRKESHSKRLKSFLEQTENDNGEEDEADDQTAALLAGFESDNDEEDPEEDVGLDIETKTKADINDETRAQLEKAPQKTDEPGVIYVGRIPHGFYESQMRAYFKQFGKVTRLRVSRNKKTGASKHYAFVEFASAEVADIVARTMNNYLMFGHILQCRIIPTAQVNANLFDGANTRFKTDPRNKKEGAAMEHGAERAVWEKRIEKAQKKRAGRAKMLQDEMDYEFTGPALKPVQEVPIVDVPKVTPAVDSADQQLLAEASAADIAEAEQVEAEPVQLNLTKTTVKVKARKAGKSTKAIAADAEVAGKKPEAKIEVEAGATDVAEVAPKTQPKKSKKGPKSKTDIKAEAVAGDLVADIKAAGQAVLDAAKSVANKAGAVTGAENTTVTEAKPKKSRSRKSRKNAADGTTEAEPAVEDVQTKTVVDKVEPEVAAEPELPAKEKKGKKAKKGKVDADANAEVVPARIEADTTPVVEAAGEKNEPVKEKKVKKAKKTKSEPTAEVAESAPVQSIVTEVVEKAKTSTKKVKAAKKSKAPVV